MVGAGFGWTAGGGGNNWDLDAVVRLGCGGGRVASPPPLSVDDDFDSFSAFLPPPLAAGAWGQPRPDYGGDLNAVVFSFGLPSPSPAPAPLQPQRRAAAVAPAALGKPLLAAAAGLQLHATAESSGGARPSCKRRTREVKTVVRRVAADKKLSPELDPWAWRKYGQKPIKGSPHPRSYYRCSTDKACQARKHVERCLAEPDAFLILTFTGEHNHPAPLFRNSLAGTTRNKHQPPPPKAAPNREPEKYPLAVVAAAAAAAAATAAAKEAEASPGKSTSGGLSPRTPLHEHSPSGESDQEEEDDEMMEANGTEVKPDDSDKAGEGDVVVLFLNPNEPVMGTGGDSMIGGGGGAATTAPIMNGADQGGPMLLNSNHQSAMEVGGGDSKLHDSSQLAPIMDGLLFWNSDMPAMGLEVDGDYTVYGGAGMAPTVNIADEEEDALLMMNPGEHGARTEVGSDYAVGLGTEQAPIVNVVEETFVVTRWLTAAGDAILAGTSAGDGVFAAEG